jgi:hypothetical protein
MKILNYVFAAVLLLLCVEHVDAQMTTPVFVSSFSSLMSAVSSSTCSSGSCTIYVTTNITVPSNVPVTQSGVQITCINSATLSFSASATLTLGGTEDQLQNCNLAGPGIGTATNAPVEITGNRVVVARNNISGFGSTGSNGIVVVAAGSGDEISDNWVLGNADQASIFVNNQTASTTISDVRIERNHAQNIIVHAYAGSSTVQHFVISGNDLFTGQNGITEFCMEIETVGANSVVSDFSVTGNHAYLLGSGTNGGYSLGGATQFSVSGNTFDSNGFTYTVAGFEFTNVANGSLSGNTSISTSTQNFLGSQRDSNVTITGNTLIGFGTAGTSAGIGIENSTPSASSSDNVISNNTIIFPSGGAGIGIWLQCNNSSATCRNNSIVGNHIASDGTAGSVGIEIADDSGTMADNLVGPNSVIGPSTGVSILGVSGPTNTKLIDGINTATTRIADNGTATLIDDRGGLSFSFLGGQAPG